MTVLDISLAQFGAQIAARRLRICKQLLAHQVEQPINATQLSVVSNSL
jgi:hypothetical protein